MKYLFASGLVFAALVMVFHVERVIPIPRTACLWAMGRVRHWLPFEAKTAYAESCLAQSRQEQFRVRYAISDAAVRLAALDAGLASVQDERLARLQRIDYLVQNGMTNSPELSVQVQAFQHARLRYDRLAEQRASLSASMQALESAESKADANINQLSHRLVLVKNEHQRHNALAMASDGSSGYGIQGPAVYVRQGESAVSAMEFDERVRDDYYLRYEVQPDADSSRLPIPAQAQAILADNSDWLR